MLLHYSIAQKLAFLCKTAETNAGIEASKIHDLQSGTKFFYLLESLLRHEDEHGAAQLLFIVSIQCQIHAAID